MIQNCVIIVVVGIIMITDDEGTRRRNSVSGVMSVLSSLCPFKTTAEVRDRELISSYFSRSGYVISGKKRQSVDSLKLSCHNLIFVVLYKDSKVKVKCAIGKYTYL